MTAKVITFGISKGGASKTTTAGITGYLLSQNHKVLLVDIDSQGNLTSFLSGEDDICNTFEEQTVLEAIKEGDVRPYILSVAKNLDIIPSNDYLSLLPRYLYRDFKGGDPNYVLRNALEPVMDHYDYIIIDTPPSLSEMTINAVFASDSVVIMFDGSQFCYYAIEKFLEICAAAKDKGNEHLQVAGILFSIVDRRTLDTKAMLDLIDDEFTGYRFNTVIQRKAATKRLPIYGFVDNPEIKKATEQYNDFIKELKDRV